jgi:GTP cyclohydrolase I
MNSPKPDFIPDVQSSPDTRHLAIDRVGIKGIRHPVKVKDKSVGVQHTIASFNMYVHLPHNFKGTHMSRFVEILNQHEREISVESFEKILGEMVTRLEAKSGYLEMSFPYFVNKTAPVSGVQSLLDYDVTLIGETVNGKNRITMKVLVPVTSLCPCSKKISERGAHNQRSHVTLSIRTNEFVWIEDVIRLRQPQVRRGYGARCGGGAGCRQAHRRLCGRVRELRVDTQPFGLCADRAGQDDKIRGVEQGRGIK